MGATKAKLVGTPHAHDSTIKRVLYAFAAAFIGSVIATMDGLGAVPNLGTAKALASSAIFAALTAGFIAAKNIVFPQGSKLR